MLQSVWKSSNISQLRSESSPRLEAVKIPAYKDQLERIDAANLECFLEFGANLNEWWAEYRRRIVPGAVCVLSSLLMSSQPTIKFTRSCLLAPS